MAVTLIAEAAGANSNSYVTVAEAQAYIDDERLAESPVQWTDADDNVKAKALITATRLIDSNMPGMKYSAGPSSLLTAGATRQVLRFPRVQDLGIDGRPAIPKPVQEATVELALYLMTGYTTDATRRSLQAQGVTSVQLGRAVREEFRPGAGRRIIDACPEAAERLRPFGLGAPIPLG